MQNLSRNQKLARTAMLIAITMVLALTPLGYIPLNPVITLTIMVTPVVLGGMLYGWKSGLLLGVVFGLTSFYKAPAEAIGQIMLAQSGLLTFLACVGPRALVGLYGGWMHRLLQKQKLRCVPAYGAMGLVGSLINTVGFLFFVLFAFDSAQTGFTFALVMGVVSYNGLIEAAGNAILVAILAKVLIKTKPRKRVNRQ